MEIEQFIVTDRECFLRESCDEEITNRNLKIIPETIPHITASLDFKMRIKFFRKDKEHHKLKVILNDEIGNTLINSGNDSYFVNIPAEEKSKIETPIFSKINFPFPHAGDYRAILIIDDEERSVFFITIEECKNQ